MRHRALRVDTEILTHLIRSRIIFIIKDKYLHSAFWGKGVFNRPESQMQILCKLIIEFTENSAIL